MTMLFAPLGLETPVAGFNGGLFVEPDLTILQEKTLPGDVARQAIHLLRWRSRCLAL
jgi:hydroxymethylpyrimidine pyrophosphatase-like HAD family hydrolase